MLLKICMIFVLSLSLFASDKYAILKKENSYSIVSGESNYNITYNGVPKIIKVEKVKDLDIIDYYAGSFGTSNLLEINHRMVIKKNKILIDAPFKYLNKTKQPVWKIDTVKKLITVKDPIGTNSKVEIK